MEVPWYGWIAIAGIAVWGVIVIIGTIRGDYSEKNGLKGALEENAAVNKALLEKLETIDDRLATVEKTLTDIQ